ncbi:MAG: type II secretion system protein [Candidatus Accumulibacter sp. UW26]|jgi:type II secretory pathway pseudopilin PulG
MRTGEGGAGRIHRGVSGYTYLGVLLLVAISAAAMVAYAQNWATVARREKEKELIFRGEEIRRAIAAYVVASGNQTQRLPRSLADLLADRRGAMPRYHLRRLYADPFTGQPDWVLLIAPGEGGIVGVRSRSPLRAFHIQGTPAGAGHDPCVCEWEFRVAADGTEQQ